MATLKTFQYRLYPTKQQHRLLSRQLEECRWLWNTLLAERKRAWEERREMVDYYEQKAALPSLKVGERPSLNEVHSQDCSGCGWRHHDLTLADRVFHCLNPNRPDCRLVLDRDVNAARNILARGRAELARLLQAGNISGDIQTALG